MKDQKRAYLFALGAVLIWSTVASAFKISLRYMEPAHLLLIATLISTLLLGSILLFKGELLTAIPRSRKEWGLSLGLGLLNPFLYYLVLFQAFNLLPAQEAQPLNYTWAITLSILAVPLLGQKLSPRDILAITISYFGVVIISTRGDLLGFHFSDLVGVALALASTIAWALYWIYNTRDSRPPIAGLFANFLCALPMVLLYCLLFAEMRMPDYPGIFGAVYVGCFEMGLSFILWLSALKYTESTAKISNLIFLSPFISLILIHFLVGEDIYGSTVVGLIFIVIGLVVQQVKKR